MQNLHLQQLCWKYSIEKERKKERKKWHHPFPHPSLPTPKACEKYKERNTTMNSKHKQTMITLYNKHKKIYQSAGKKENTQIEQKRCTRTSWYPRERSIYISVFIHSPSQTASYTTVPHRTTNRHTLARPTRYGSTSKAINISTTTKYTKSGHQANLSSISHLRRKPIYSTAFYKILVWS